MNLTLNSFHHACPIAATVFQVPLLRTYNRFLCSQATYITGSAAQPCTASVTRSTKACNFPFNLSSFHRAHCSIGDRFQWSSHRSLRQCPVIYSRRCSPHNNNPGAMSIDGGKLRDAVDWVGGGGRWETAMVLGKNCNACFCLRMTADVNYK